MPSLILSYNDQELHTYEIEKDRILRIGRSDQNDVIIDETAVSGLHAEIEFDSDGYYITDIQSKNGTFVDGELVISRKLKDGNMISIGNYVLRFQIRQNEAIPDESAHKTVTQATMMLDTAIHRSKLAKSLSEIGEDKKIKKQQAMIAFLDGSKEAFPIDKPLIRIGKDPDCDIHIKGFFIGKSAAEIVHKEKLFYLKPDGEKSKVRLNYQLIKKETLLKDFDVIEIGSNKMQFHIKIL